MATKDFKRKLSAIFSADVAGYSRLMGDDEGTTVETITAYRKVMTDFIQEHQGMVVDAKGDNVLAEFPSVVDAIQCAVEIQKELKMKNADLPKHRRMAFRIGVNLGDVIEKEDTIYGDGVNIAARLESLADGGGICISGTAFDQVGKKLPLGYEYLGEQTVKNIEKPIRVYKVLVEPEAVGKVIGENPRLRVWHWTAIFGLAVLIIVAGALTLWEFYVRPDVAPASVEKMAYPLPDKPSIAVLAFDNMSGDPKQEYFSDGITEGIITALSSVPELFVIARNSAFTYKGKPVMVKQVAEELGVNYVLEGSVQESGGKVRITAQLIDALTGRHLWAESFDRKLEDIFALQDEITMKIITELRVKLADGEQARIMAKGTDNLEAFLKFLQGRDYIRRYNEEGNALARKMAEQAMALDSEFPGAYRLLAGTHMMDVWFRWSKSPRDSIKKGISLSKKANAIDPSFAGAHGTLAHFYTLARQHEKAIAEGEKAIALDPNSADLHGFLGMALNFADRPNDAIPLFEKAIRLNPIPSTFYLHNLGVSYRMTGRYDEAIEVYKKALQRSPTNLFAHLGLTATYSLSGQETEAHAQAEEVMKINPKFSLQRFSKVLPFKNQATNKRVIDALRKAGLK